MAAERSGNVWTNTRSAELAVCKIHAIEFVGASEVKSANWASTPADGNASGPDRALPLQTTQEVFPKLKH